VVATLHDVKVADKIAGRLWLWWVFEFGKLAKLLTYYFHPTSLCHLRLQSCRWRLRVSGFNVQLGPFRFNVDTSIFLIRGSSSVQPELLVVHPVRLSGERDELSSSQFVLPLATFHPQSLRLFVGDCQSKTHRRFGTHFFFVS
jgi:hypothetical protein